VTLSALLGSSGFLQRCERFIDLRRGTIAMQQFVQLRAREATGIIQQSAMDLLRERVTRRVPERPRSTPSGIVPQRERRLEMLELDRACAIQQSVDQRQPHAVRFSARGKRTRETLHRPLGHLFIRIAPAPFGARVQTEPPSPPSVIERLREPILQPSLREGVLFSA